MKVEDVSSIDIDYTVLYWVRYGKAMKKADGTDPPRNIAIKDDRYNDEETREMVDDYSLLTDRLPSINNILYD